MCTITNHLHIKRKKNEKEKTIYTFVPVVKNPRNCRKWLSLGVELGDSEKEESIRGRLIFLLYNSWY